MNSIKINKDLLNKIENLKKKDHIIFWKKDNLIKYRTPKTLEELSDNLHNVIEDFNSKVESLMKLIFVLAKQNTKLREARDILLPKLMNGQIEVYLWKVNQNLVKLKQKKLSGW